MLTRISMLAWALLAVTGVSGANHGIINKDNGNIDVNSEMGQNIMQHARALDQDGNYQQVDTSFLSGYSVKFQGCHHVQQWNDNADGEDDVRIMTKRLVRFRLCPQSDCTSELSGCTSKYGDYVVDMGTFVSAYMNAGNGGNYQNQGQRDLSFDIADYTQCAQIDMRRHLDQNANAAYSYYVGPYCADQGGEIHLGVFTDDTCSSFATNGESLFYQSTGMSLPYTSQSMVSLNCMGCGSYNNGAYAISDFCQSVYAYSGKCETRMNVDYPNESSCSYIEGIKIIREDGVIRTSSSKKSKAAAVCIGLFLTIAVLLAGYVYYLRTKLGRAKINLAAASQTL